jgi:hypothetical protein
LSLNHNPGGRTLNMKHGIGVKSVGDITFALLAIIAFSHWVLHRIECGESLASLSNGAVFIVASIWALIFMQRFCLQDSSPSSHFS